MSAFYNQVCISRTKIRKKIMVVVDLQNEGSEGIIIDFNVKLSGISYHNMYLIKLLYRSIRHLKNENPL